ncbi:ferredoxin [Mycobacterium florentinum]|uniref:Ferredoxin n=1 Tax=Mycobacterium florentinum TaxID=292462 RepID=A0A1X1TWX9_MYCFL|nr:ferredoxin [Mycobacterium florentinum]MCV7413524.1 ferredoxin [Mycobacterium florentinum]ORV49073.1 ferredoxin [Mycobacterium florentinum]BBX77066.1 ferredoxin [Mycobacterium florentinum]
MTRAFVDAQRCHGHGRCEIIAPQVFAVGDDGISQILVEEIDPTDLADVQEAGFSCPEQAITLE